MNSERLTKTTRPPLLNTIEQAAARLGVGRSTLYGFIASGALKGVKLGGRTVFQEEELKRFAGSLKASA